MENRFGVKDFFLFLIIGVLIVLVVLTMFQYDRQWALEQATNRQVNDLTSDVSRIRTMLAQGGAQIQTSGQAASETNVGFERILKSQSQPDYAEGDDLVQITDSQPPALTPMVNMDAYTQVMEYYMYDSLVDLDPDTFQWLPRLAVKWTTSPDMKTLDFWLRRGVTFSNGDPFTADDVIYSFNWVLNDKVQLPMQRSYLDTLTSVEKIDDFHVRFHFSESYFMSFDAVAYQNVLIMDKKFYSQYTPDQFNTNPGLVIGTGPYRLADPTSWRPEPGKPVILVRNERYYGPRPSFNRIIWKVIEDPTARATTFENGDADFWGPGFFGPHPEQYDHFIHDPALSARARHYNIDSPTTGFQYIGWNERHGRDGPPTYFADPRVRRAMTMLIDRWRIVKTLVNGYATVVSGPFWPKSDQEDPSVKPWPYDPAAAEKLLAEANFVKRGGILYGPDGKPFEFKFLYTPVSDVGRRLVPIVHDALAEAGILVIPDPQDWTVLLDRINDRQFDCVAMGWSGAVPNDDPYQIFHSSQMAGAGDDFIQLNNKELDDTIVQARQTLDHDQRTELWHKVDRIIHEQEPYTFLYAEDQLSLIDNRIHGVEPTRLGLMYQIQDWYVPKALQKYTQY
ncbi:MAG TPA: ABC transporter substrate-binding protein [Tepidisphaeraceae bacterium]|nr:ABC transporter substrate-binding protein [Tepidisphaeraceae bacterium]